MKTIEITVSPAGETKVETKGFVGNDCQSASRSLILALGVRESETLKSEFYQQATQASQSREQSNEQ